MLIFECAMSHFPNVVLEGNTIPQVVVSQFVAVTQFMFLLAIALGLYEKLKKK